MRTSLYGTLTVYICHVTYVYWVNLQANSEWRITQCDMTSAYSFRIWDLIFFAYFYTWCHNAGILQGFACSRTTVRALASQCHGFIHTLIHTFIVAISNKAKNSKFDKHRQWSGIKQHMNTWYWSG